MEIQEESANELQTKRSAKWVRLQCTKIGLEYRDQHLITQHMRFPRSANRQVPTEAAIIGRSPGTVCHPEWANPART
jgi:hypothetical protein